MWGAVAGAAISAASKLWSDYQSRQNASSANAFTREMMQNRHQWEVEDLRKAGLNPILSTHAAPSMGSAAVAQSQPIDFAESGSKFSASQLAREQARTQREQQELLRDQQLLAKSQSARELSQARKTAAETVSVEKENRWRDAEGMWGSKFLKDELRSPGSFVGALSDALKQWMQGSNSAKTVKRGNKLKPRSYTFESY